MRNKPSVLVIYTGGTIGMIRENQDGSLIPVDFERLQANIPEIARLEATIDTITFDQSIDSSEMNTTHWIKLVEIIEENYDKYHGFVILHGSDTMAFSASALSFMIENLNKPIIFTGSQLPLGVLRTDAKENFITSLEIAASHYKGLDNLAEVCIYFEYHLLKGNRTTKYSASQFNAFQSANYPPLAEAGVEIKFRELEQSTKRKELPVRFHKKLDNNIAILKIFPGMSESYVKGILEIQGLRAVVIETFGSGNAPTADWFIARLQKAISQGIILVNVTQCTSGRVIQGKYKTSEKLLKIGVVSGHDITTESALTKLMFLLGNYSEPQKIRELFSTPVSGEMTIQEMS